MNHAVGGLVDIVDDESNQKHDDIACHNIKIVVIDRQLDGLLVAIGKSSNGRDDVSQVAGGCSQRSNGFKPNREAGAYQQIRVVSSHRKLVPHWIRVSGHRMREHYPRGTFDRRKMLVEVHYQQTPVFDPPGPSQASRCLFQGMICNHACEYPSGPFGTVNHNTIAQIF